MWELVIHTHTHTHTHTYTDTHKPITACHWKTYYGVQYFMGVSLQSQQVSRLIVITQEPEIYGNGKPTESEGIARGQGRFTLQEILGNPCYN